MAAGDFLSVPFWLKRGSFFATYGEWFLRRKRLVRLTLIDQSKLQLTNTEIGWKHLQVECGVKYYWLVQSGWCWCWILAKTQLRNVLEDFRQDLIEFRLRHIWNCLGSSSTRCNWILAKTQFWPLLEKI